MKSYLFFLIIIASAFSNGAQTINDWENPDINGIHKERPHAYGFFAAEKAHNPAIQSLNGLMPRKILNLPATTMNCQNAISST